MCSARRAGEEVTHTYSIDLERNDMSLINHFFVQDLQPPRLCALDLPGGHLNGGLIGPDSSFLPRFPDELEVGAWRSSGPPCLPWHCWHVAKGVATKLDRPGHYHCAWSTANLAPMHGLVAASMHTSHH